MHMPKKMSLNYKNQKYLPRRKDATENYVYQQHINFSQYEIRSVTQLLAFQCTYASVSKQHVQVPVWSAAPTTVIQK